MVSLLVAFVALAHRRPVSTATCGIAVRGWCPPNVPLDHYCRVLSAYISLGYNWTLLLWRTLVKRVEDQRSPARLPQCDFGVHM